MLVAVIVLAVLVALLLAYAIWQNSQPRMTGDAASLLKTDISELAKSMGDLKESLQVQLTETVKTSNKQMAQQFAASSKIIQDVTHRLTELDRTNKNVGDIASELKTLQNVLQNPKQRGVL